MKLIKTVYTLLFFVSITFYSHAQQESSFQGIIKYTQSVTGSDGKLLAGMMEKSYECTIGPDKALIKVEGGIMWDILGHEALIDFKTGVIHMINHNGKSIAKFSSPEDFSLLFMDLKETPVFTSVQEKTIKVKGFPCKKYETTYNTAKGKVQESVWATDNFRIPKLHANDFKTSQFMIFMKNLSGTVLKIEQIYDPMFWGDLKVTIEATDIVKKEIAESAFKLPEEYTVNEIDRGVVIDYKEFVGATFPLDDDETSDENKIADVYQNLVDNILEGNFDSIPLFIDKNSSNYYKNLKDIILNEDSSFVSQLKIIDKYLVLCFRTLLTKEQVLKMTETEMFIYSVERNLLSAKALGKLSLGGMFVDPDSARTEIQENNLSIIRGQKFRFTKENNNWKFDWTSFIDFTNHSFQLLVKPDKDANNANDVAMTLADIVTQGKVTNQVWKPIK